MATYAMICNDTVIDVLYNQEEKPNWPPDPVGNPVVAIICNDEATGNWLYNPETKEVYEPTYTDFEEPEAFVDESEYEQYYNMVNAAILGGE